MRGLLPTLFVILIFICVFVALARTMTPEKPRRMRTKRELIDAYADDVVVKGRRPIHAIDWSTKERHMLGWRQLDDWERRFQQSLTESNANRQYLERGKSHEQHVSDQAVQMDQVG